MSTAELATRTRPRDDGDIDPGSRCFVLRDISWGDYQKLLEIFSDRYLRHTYYKGELELVSPSKKHESVKTVLGDFLATLCRVLRMPREGLGSTTMHHESSKSGLEPDEGFYLSKKSLADSDRDDFDPAVDPAPDLIIEVDVSASSKQRMEIYRNMRVPEVWRHRKGQVTIHRLGRDRKYREVRRSKWFAFLGADDLTRFVEMRSEKDDTELELAFEEWVREQVA